MKPIFVALLLPSLLLADFRYESTTRITGGTVTKLPFGKKPEPTTTTHYMKGGRMATVSKDGTTILDFDKQLYIHIDSAKKQYWQSTFAEMQQAMADLQKEMQDAQQKANAKAKDVQAEWKVDVKATGVEKDVNGIMAKQVLMTMEMVATSPSAKDSGMGSMRMTMDMWQSEKVPGYSEYLKFFDRMKDKGSWLNPQQLNQMAGQNGMAEGIRKMTEEMRKVPGLPVLSITKMGMSGMPDMSGAGGGGSSANGGYRENTPQNNTSVGDAVKTAGGQAAGSGVGRSVGGPIGGMLGGALGGKLGGFGRKPKTDPAAAKQAEEEAARAQQAQSQAEADARKTAEAMKPDAKTGMMILSETVSDSSGFSTAPIGEEVFAIPAGYTKVDSDFMKRKR